jgi:aminoglycoside phosphotransferase family enzyme/predicted kinase
LNELEDWQRVADALSDGSLLGVSPDGLERHETHMSIVVLSGEVVYKLKKPVVFDFADYGTRDRRRELCEAEIPLNRRLAPRLYLGTAAVVASGEHLQLEPGINSDALEHLVVMRRLAVEDMLDWKVDRDLVSLAEMERVGRTLAAFHTTTAPAPAAAWSPKWIRGDLERRFDLLRAQLPAPLDANIVAAVEEFLDRWLTRDDAVLRRRAADGWVRDGHGDLRLEHVAPGDPVEVIDCVEFSPELRQADVLSDLAFLVMELELAKRDDLATSLYGAWAEAGGPLDEPLLWIYASMRALIRVDVALRRADQLSPGIQQEMSLEHARSLLRLAEELTWRARPPTAIVIGGLSGSGKTTIATHLAERWGLQRLSSDEVRKSLVGVGKSDLAPEDAYVDSLSLLVYERLGMRAGQCLEAGRSVIVDATFRRKRDCEAFGLGLARATTRESPVVSVGLTADPDELRDRLTRRQRAGGSDATLDVLEHQLHECPTGVPGLRGAIPAPTDGDFAHAVRRVASIVLDGTLR